MKNVDVVSVTGTKGKTTVVSILSEVLRKLSQKETLHVTTLGHYLNGIQRSTLESSQATWGLVPTVCPGRYLWEFVNVDIPGLAVLEMSVGSSNLPGLGYIRHDVGVFLNVFSDHITDFGRLKTRADIAQAKAFIFSRTHPNGWVVYNHDDEMIASVISQIPNETRVVTFGLEPASGTSHVTISDGEVVLQAEGVVESIVSVADIVWTFDGKFTPSLYNLLAVTASVIAYSDGKIPVGLESALRESRLDPYGGRLTQLHNDRDVKILIDYAHEEESLKAVATLARSMTAPDGRVIGVLRLAYDRTDTHIKKVATEIVDGYDQFIVYDKIDGFHRHPKAKEQLINKNIPQETGRTSQVFADALLEVGGVVDRIVREDDAIEFAASIAKSGDVVVHIVSDDVRRSIDWVREGFSADFT